eukprot:2875424-Rhodomonas_salina.2
MSGTDIAYCAVSLRICHAMCSAEIAYLPTELLRDVRTEIHYGATPLRSTELAYGATHCAVLRERMSQHGVHTERAYGGVRTFAVA